MFCTTTCWSKSKIKSRPSRSQQNDPTPTPPCGFPHPWDPPICRCHQGQQPVACWPIAHPQKQRQLVCWEGWQPPAPKFQRHRSSPHGIFWKPARGTTVAAKPQGSQASLRPHLHPARIRLWKLKPQIYCNLCFIHAPEIDRYINTHSLWHPNLCSFFVQPCHPR